MIGRLLRKLIILTMFVLGALLYILGLGLLERTALFVTAAIAWVILSLGAVTFGSRAGKRVTGAASLTLALIFVQVRFPGVWESVRGLVSRTDQTVRKSVSAYTSEEPQRIDCASRLAGGGFFDSKDGTPLVFYRIGKDDQVECFDAPGYHPITRQKLEPVTPEIVDRIVRSSR
jgi:hypothetical protein